MIIIMMYSILQGATREAACNINTAAAFQT